MNRRLGGSQSWSEHLVEEMNLLPLAGIEPHNTQTIASHYTNYTILALTNIVCIIFYLFCYVSRPMQ
jgi:hypothetical protein